jgi:multidrug efflux pump subunit AcrA (membrane-fusion protein)
MIVPPLGEDLRLAALWEKLRTFDGPPVEFWPAFLVAAAETAGATSAVLWVPANGSWCAMLSAPDRRQAERAQVDPPGDLLTAAATGFARVARDGVELVGFRVGSPDLGGGVVVLHFAGSTDEPGLRSRCVLLAAIPEGYQAAREAARMRRETELVTGVLDLALVAAREQRFDAAALAVVNAVAARFRCDRVSLGWDEGELVRLRAISQADKFDRKLRLVRQLEVAMEECLDQDEELAWPAGGESNAVVRELGNYAREAGVAHLLAVPLRSGGEPAGAWVLERAGGGFDETEVQQLRLAADQVGPRLRDLRERQRWFGARAWRGLKRFAAGFLGPKHTGPKLAGVAGALLVLFLVFGRWTYSVEAPAVLRSGQVAFVTAPFDGYIRAAVATVGDEVAPGAPLASLDTRDLLLQQAAEMANLNRFLQEAERARAQDARAEMRIAQAQAEQARATLERVQHQIAQAELVAPFAGAIVEGDLRRRLGSPTRQGEVLFQVAQLDDLYVSLEVAERDVHEIFGRTEARLRFSARPDLEYALVIERLHPAGQPGPGGPVFIVRARAREAENPEWWRPGMSGTARIEVGRRPVIWILTHRTTAWLRRQLWW